MAILYLYTFIGPLPSEIDFIYDKTSIYRDNVKYKIDSFYKENDIFYINDIPFKAIPGFPNYIISDTGVIYSLITNKFLYIKINQGGYYVIGITDESNIRKFRAISRLVYITWGNKILLDTDEVNHMDGKKWNNYIKNLEPTTALENTRHAIKNNLRYSKWSATEIENICRKLCSGKNPIIVYNDLDLSNKLSYNDFKVLIHHLKHKTKFWVDVSSKFDFSNAYSRIKYTTDQLLEVKQLLTEGIRHIDIETMTGVDYKTISAIKHGKYRNSIFENHCNK